MRPLDVEIRTKQTVPLMAGQVAAGFPSPADDFQEHPLDFNELLVRNPTATFAVRAQGDSMVGVGIFNGDICVVDRSMKPADGCVVVALLDGAFTMKRLRMKGQRVWLQAENPQYPDIPVTDGSEFEIWGVVTHAVRTLQRGAA